MITTQCLMHRMLTDEEMNFGSKELSLRELESEVDKLFGNSEKPADEIPW
jgi:hypothetical protein